MVFTITQPSSSYPMVFVRYRDVLTVIATGIGVRVHARWNKACGTCDFCCFKKKKVPRG